MRVREGAPAGQGWRKKMHRAMQYPIVAQMGFGEGTVRDVLGMAACAALFVALLAATFAGMYGWYLFTR